MPSSRAAKDSDHQRILRKRALQFNHADPLSISVDLPFEIRKPMKTVDVTIAVQKTRFVEFLASPTRPTPVGAGGKVKQRRNGARP